MASLPLRAANMSAVKPPVGWSALWRSVSDVTCPWRLGSAPASSSRSTTSTWPSAAAHISAVPS